MKKILVLMIVMMVLVSGVVFAPEEDPLKDCFDSEGRFKEECKDKIMDWNKVTIENLVKCMEDETCIKKIGWSSINLEGISKEDAKKILAAAGKENLKFIPPKEMERALEAIVPGASISIGPGGMEGIEFIDGTPPMLKKGDGNSYPLENVESLKIEGGEVEIKYRGGIPEGTEINGQPIEACDNCDININCEGPRCTINVVNGPVRVNSLPPIESGSVTYSTTLVGDRLTGVNARFSPCDINNDQVNGVPTLCLFKIYDKSIQIPDEGGHVNLQMGDCRIGTTQYKDCININEISQNVRVINQVCTGVGENEQCKILGLLTAGRGGIRNANIAYTGHVNVPNNGEYEDWSRCIQTIEGKCAIPLQRPRFSGGFTAIYGANRMLASGSIIGPGSNVNWGDVGVGHRRYPYSDRDHETQVFFSDGRPDGRGNCNPEQGTGCAQFWPNGVRAYAAGEHSLRVIGGPENDPSRIVAVVDPGSVYGVGTQRLPEGDGRTRVLPEVSCWDRENCAAAGIKIEDAEGHNYIIKFKKDGKVDIRDSWRKNMPPDGSLILLSAFDDVSVMESEGAGDPNNKLANKLLIIRGDHGDVPGGYFYATRCDTSDDDCPAEGYLVDTRKSNLRGGICDDPTGNFGVEDSGISICQRQFSTILAETSAPCEGSRIFKVDCDEGQYSTAATAIVGSTAAAEPTEVTEEQAIRIRELDREIGTCCRTRGCDCDVAVTALSTYLNNALSDAQRQDLCDRLKKLGERNDCRSGDPNAHTILGGFIHDVASKKLGTPRETAIIARARGYTGNPDTGITMTSGVPKLTDVYGTDGQPPRIVINSPTRDGQQIVAVWDAEAGDYVYESGVPKSLIGKHAAIRRRDTIQPEEAAAAGATSTETVTEQTTEFGTVPATPVNVEAYKKRYGDNIQNIAHGNVGPNNIPAVIVEYDNIPLLRERGYRTTAIEIAKLEWTERCKPRQATTVNCVKSENSYQCFGTCA